MPSNRYKLFIATTKIVNATPALQINMYAIYAKWVETPRKNARSCLRSRTHSRFGIAFAFFVILCYHVSAPVAVAAGGRSTMTSQNHESVNELKAKTILTLIVCAVLFVIMPVCSHLAVAEPQAETAAAAEDGAQPEILQEMTDESSGFNTGIFMACIILLVIVVVVVVVSVVTTTSLPIIEYFE